jgi:hypothetical protein
MVYRMDTGIHWLWNAGRNERRHLLLWRNLVSLVSSTFISSLMKTKTHRGVIGPILVAKGLAFGTAASRDPVWASLMNYASLGSEFTTVDHPSPRYWLLWPGVLCMIAVSFTGLFELLGTWIKLMKNRRACLSMAYLLAKQSNGLERCRGHMPTIVISYDEKNATVK